MAILSVPRCAVIVTPLQRGIISLLSVKNPLTNKLPHGCFVCAKGWQLQHRNASNGLYISPDSPNNQALRTVANTPAKGWTLKPSNELGYFIITSGTVQFNQTNNSGQGYHIFNWGGGTNTSDTGCKYQITHVFSEGGSTSVGSYPTINPNDLPSPVYYDLSGRRVYHPTRGFYILNGQKVLLK